MKVSRRELLGAESKSSAAVEDVEVRRKTYGGEPTLSYKVLGIITLTSISGDYVVSLGLHLTYYTLPLFSLISSVDLFINEGYS